MKIGASLLLALYASFMSFTIQTYIWGEKGVTAYKRLESYKERLEKNDERLEEIHQTLNARFRRYTDDRETIELAARSLGYYDERETRVYIEGYEYAKPFYLVGRSIGEYTPLKVNSMVFRIVAVIVGILTFVAARSRYRRKW